MVMVMAELGAVLSDAGRASEAIEVLTQAVKLRPTMFEAYYNLGVAHESLKRWPEAIAAYSKAIKLTPTDANPRASQADAQYNLAVAYRRGGRLRTSGGTGPRGGAACARSSPRAPEPRDAAVGHQAS